MAKEFFGVRATAAITRLIQSALATKQDKIKGEAGEIPVFGPDGQLTSSDELRKLKEYLDEI